MTTPRALSPAYRLAAALIRPPLMVLTRRDWRGAEHLPRDRGFIACGNHVSHFDPLTFAHFLHDNGCPPRFLAKDAVFRIPVLGRIIAGAGQIPVYRETAAAGSAFRSAVAAVEAGECLAVYPEGTLTRDPELWPMIGKTGAARIALATGAPVVPIAQWGPQEILAPYGRHPHLLPRRIVSVWAGPPVDLSRFAAQAPTSEVLREATDVILDAVTELLEQIRGETAPQRRWDPRDHGQARIGNWRHPARRRRRWSRARRGPRGERGRGSAA